MFVHLMSDGLKNLTNTLSSRVIPIIICIFLSGVSFGQEKVPTEEQISILRYEMLDASMKVASIEVGEDNAIWFCTNSGIHKIISIQRQPESYLSGINIQDVTMDSKGQAYAAGLTELYEVESGERINLPSASAIINDIDYYNGLVWIATTEGVFRYRPTTGKIDQLTKRNSKLRSDMVHFVKADARGKLWLGTDDGSVEITGDKWRNDFKGEKVTVSRENDEGQWFITDEDMYIISKFGRLIAVGLDDKLFQGTLNDFVFDSKGRIYFASDILVRYNPYTEKIESYADDAGLISKRCVSLACDKNDNIWIGTQEGGLYRILFSDIVAEQLAGSILVERQPSCSDASDGKLKVSVSGGTEPYKYEWSVAGARRATPSNLAAGDYTVTVSDKYNASFVTSIDLVAPEAIEMTVLSKDKISAPGKDDGSAIIAIAGGTPPYKVMWSHGKTGTEMSNLRYGRYEIDIRDSKGCTHTDYLQIEKDKFLPELDIAKVNIGQKLRINELKFDADSSAVKIESHEVLDELYQFLQDNKQVKVEIGGHTNLIPSHEYCDRLSTERAQNVAKYLYSKGIATDRIRYKGYGKRDPLANGTSRSANLKNQRVEVKILSIEG